MNMQRLVGAGVLILLSLAGFAAVEGGTPSAGAAHRTTYRVVHGWPILPDGEALGSVAGVGVDSHGNVFVFHRAGRTWPASDELELKPIARPTVAVFDGHGGALLARWGSNLFAMPHGLTVDDHDN